MGSPMNIELNCIQLSQASHFETLQESHLKFYLRTVYILMGIRGFFLNLIGIPKDLRHGFFSISRNQKIVDLLAVGFRYIGDINRQYRNLRILEFIRYFSFLIELNPKCIIFLIEIGSFNAILGEFFLEEITLPRLAITPVNEFETV